MERRKKWGIIIHVKKHNNRTVPFLGQKGGGGKMVLLMFNYVCTQVCLQFWDQLTNFHKKKIDISINMFSNNYSNLILIMGYFFLVFKNGKVSVICMVAHHHKKKSTESNKERPQTIHLGA